MEEFDLTQSIKILLDKVILLESEVKKISGKAFYSTTEFASKLGVDDQLIRKYCKRGILRATQISKNGSWQIEASELKRLQDEAEQRFKKAKSGTVKNECTTKRDNIIKNKKKPARQLPANQ